MTDHSRGSASKPSKPPPPKAIETTFRDLSITLPYLLIGGPANGQIIDLPFEQTRLIIEGNSSPTSVVGPICVVYERLPRRPCNTLHFTQAIPLVEGLQ